MNVDLKKYYLIIYSLFYEIKKYSKEIFYQIVEIFRPTIKKFIITTQVSFSTKFLNPMSRNNVDKKMSSTFLGFLAFFQKSNLNTSGKKNILRL